MDDRIWCHPKFVGLTDAAFRAWMHALTYSSGFLTRGTLTDGQLKGLRVAVKPRRELAEAGLWVEVDGGVVIVGWEEHNGSRDDRRVKDRERKRRKRAAERMSAGLSAEMSADVRADVQGLTSEVVTSEGHKKLLRAVLDGESTNVPGAIASSRGAFVGSGLLKDMPA